MPNYKKTFASIPEANAYAEGVCAGANYAGGNAEIERVEETADYKKGAATVKQDEAYCLKCEARLAKEIDRFKVTFEHMGKRQKEREINSFIAKLDDLKARETKTLQLAAALRIPVAGLWANTPARGNDR